MDVEPSPPGGTWHPIGRFKSRDSVSVVLGEIRHFLDFVAVVSVFKEVRRGCSGGGGLCKWFRKLNYFE